VTSQKATTTTTIITVNINNNNQSINQSSHERKTIKGQRKDGGVLREMTFWQEAIQRR
jgi:hypothetical protein